MTQLLTIEQVADRLQCHPRTVRRAIDRGGLRAVQVGEVRGLRVELEDLNVWLERRATRPRAAESVGVVSTLPGPRARRRRSSGVLQVPSRAVGE